MEGAIPGFPNRDDGEILPGTSCPPPGSFWCGTWQAERGALGVEEGLFDRVGGERPGGVVGGRGFGVAAEAA